MSSPNMFPSWAVTFNENTPFIVIILGDYLLPKLIFFAESTVMKNNVNCFTEFAHVLTQMAPHLAKTMLQDQNKETLVQKLAEQIPPYEQSAKLPKGWFCGMILANFKCAFFYFRWKKVTKLLQDELSNAGKSLPLKKSNCSLGWNRAKAYVHLKWFDKL